MHFLRVYYIKIWRFSVQSIALSMQTSFKYDISKQGEIMNVQLCILNAQGIILDNNKTLIALWTQTAAKHGIPISGEFFESFLAAGFDQRNKVFYQYPRLAAIESEVMDQYRMIPPSFHPDIESVTESLKKLGIKIAIVSDTRRQDIYPTLESFMRKHDIEVLVCANEVLSAKPDPNIYFKAAKLSHVKPLHTLVIDDSRNGCYSAHLAFMRSIFYQNALPISERLFKYSYRQISQLTDLIQIIEQENDPQRVISYSSKSKDIISMEVLSGLTGISMIGTSSIPLIRENPMSKGMTLLKVASFAMIGTSLNMIVFAAPLRISNES
jgi:HAD superfamily hydrolase (TIGR01509 family)